MKTQVLTVEQIRELKELGFKVPDESAMCWCYYEPSVGHEDEGGEYQLEINEYEPKRLEDPDVPTLTLTEIIDLLPQFIEEKEIGRFDFKKDEIVYESYDALNKDSEPYVLEFYTIGYENCKTLLDCAFNMLKWCIINEELNQ